MKSILLLAIHIFALIFLVLLCNNTVYANNDNPIQFSCFEEMKEVPPGVGQYIYTRGFYTENDGGAGKYLISNSSLSNLSIPINNGLFATLQIDNNLLNIDQLGAHGDGINDDSNVIQRALDSGYSVQFGINKEYKLISNGLAVKKNITILGNNSTVIVDDSYAPTSSNFQRFVLRSGYEVLDNLTITNLNFDCRVLSPKYSGSDYLCILQPLLIKNVALNNVDISVIESDNKIVNFWLYCGCDNLELDGCTFTNNTVGSEGGIVFLKSDTDPRINYFSSFKNVAINNCHFIGQCSDEAIAIWGPNNINCSINNSTLEWSPKRKDHVSRAINIAQNDISQAIYNIQICNSNITVNSANADSVIGVGSINPSNINVFFSGCSFDANVRDSFLHFQLLQKTPDGISNFSFGTNKYNINFDACIINCNKTITGSNSFYNSGSMLNWAIDCNFSNCTINCNYAFTVLSRFSKTTHYYVPTINLDSSTVNVNNAIGFIYKTNHAAFANVSINNCHINSPRLSELSTYRYKDSNGTGITQSNVISTDTIIQNSELNHHIVSQ